VFISNLQVGSKTMRNAGLKVIRAILLLSILLLNVKSVALAYSDQAQPAESGQSDTISSAINDFQLPESGIGERLSEKASTLDNLQIAKSINTSANSANLQSSSQCVQPPAGLIDWWTADGNIYDIVGGHHGTLVGGTTFVPGMVGQAFSFDGVDDSIDLGNWFNLQAFTITMWVRAGTTQQTYADIIDNNHNNGANWVVQQNGSQTNRYYFYYKNGVTPVVNLSSQWSHLAISHDTNGNRQTYLDGILLETSNEGAINYNGAQFLRLARWGGGGRNWKGELDEIDVYNRSLNQSEIANLYNAGANGKCRNVETTFDAGNEDWSVINDGSAPTHSISGGVANSGYISSSDLDQGSYWYWNAPAKFLGDMSMAYNGNLSFYLKQSITDNQSDQDDVILIGGGLTLVYNTSTNPGLDWTHYLVPINETVGWTNKTTGLDATRDQLLSVLSNLQALRIRGEYAAEPNSSSIDNVILTRHYEAENCKTSGDMVIASGDICTLYAGEYTFNNVLIQAGGKLMLHGNPTLNQGVTINATNLIVATGGKINASGAGYVCPNIFRSHGAGPGAGQFGTNSGDWWRGGGGGGYGSNGQNSSGAGGPAYGSATNPTDLGSSGGTGTYHYGGTWLGGTGGGALHLNLSGMLTVNGEIAADGNPGTGYPGYASGGGGSGGSIWIETNTLTGNGTIHANGGGHEPIGGSGGGGRIAVYAENSNHTITFSASGGPGYEVTGKGTIYFGIIDPAKSSVEISPSQLTAGTNTATLTVTVRNTDNLPIPNKTVKVAIVSGDSLEINGSTVVTNEYFSLGNTNSNGIITATLTTNKSGERTIGAQVGQESIDEQAVVNFIPGNISETVSRLQVSPTQVPADGSTPSQITVTVLDENNNPIPGAAVTLQEDSESAIITQPANLTDAQGRTTGQVVNSVVETVTVSASAVKGTDSKQLTDTDDVIFKGADLSVVMTAPPDAPAGADVQYPFTININNSNYLAAQNITIEVTLPSGITYLRDTSNLTKTQSGQTLSWVASTLPPGGRISFTLYGKISSSLPLGTSLSTQIAVSTSTSEDSLANNSTTVNTSLVDGDSFEAFINPTTQTLGSGATGIYEIVIRNTGLLADVFNVSVTGLDSEQYELSQTQMSLSPQETGKAILSVQTDSCAVTYAFDANITSQSTGENLVRSATTEFQAVPGLSNLQPNNGTMIGSKDVTISWHTDAATTGILTVYPVGETGNSRTYQTLQGNSHSVVVPTDQWPGKNTFNWYVTATSTCGMNTLPIVHNQFTVSDGVAFQNHTQYYEINRDYNQTAQVLVTNKGNKTREVQVEIQHSYQDLVVNFTGSGSIDEKITLLPGESRSIELAIYAQDAELIGQDYVLNAVLTSTDGADTITDFATIKVRVLFAANYTITKVSTDALNISTYRVTNLGQPITDLYINAVDRNTQLPASVYITPQIAHARLGTNEFLEFKVIPLYYAQGLAANPPALKVWASMVQQSGFDLVDIVSKVGDAIRYHETEQGCGGGKNLYPVTLRNVVMELPFTTHFCLNTGEVNIDLSLPPFINPSNILGASLSMNLDPPGEGTEPYDLDISMNGQSLFSQDNTTLQGTYNFPIDVDDLKTGSIHDVTNTINVKAELPNAGHKALGTNGYMYIRLYPK